MGFHDGWMNYNVNGYKPVSNYKGFEMGLYIPYIGWLNDFWLVFLVGYSL
jgi:hypothetical protein